ncbi:MAG: HmuY family protein [Cyclobacteriaceae bacterium]
MKYLFHTCYPLFFALLFLAACSEDEEAPTPVALEVEEATDIPADADVVSGDPSQAPPPEYTFYSLEQGAIIDKADSNSTQWDIALAGTTILVNGGISGPGQGAAQIIEGIFEEIEEAPESGYQTDSESELAIPGGSGNGWYTYTAEGNPPNAILPIPGRVIVLRTAEGNYAKMEILSYYAGNPDTSTEEFASFQTRPDDRYYTFNYVIQTDGSRNF